MATRNLPAQDVLNQLLSYDPETGKLFWKERERSWFSNERAYASWNAKYAGREAFTAINSHGYQNGSILSVKYNKHRVIWKMVHGEEALIIDHDNRQRGDNRLKNLVNGTKGSNCRNRRRHANNTSGANGVSWRKDSRKWEAFIRVGGKQVKLGSFDEFDGAVNARKEAEVTHGYHQNHGQ